jgi:hypothetical protein
MQHPFNFYRDYCAYHAWCAAREEDDEDEDDAYDA